jgi:hypothetical protein
LINKTIFTFWEPVGKVLPYIKLCRETWNRHLDDWEIIDLNYSNISSYIPSDILDIETLKQIPLPIQKDAIMIAVLVQHGGLFMDMDTLVMDKIDSIVEKISDSEIIMFTTHMAFVAARPDSLILRKCLDKNQNRLLSIKSGAVSSNGLPWLYLGNEVLNETMEELTNQTDQKEPIKAMMFNQGFKVFRSIVNIAEKLRLPKRHVFHAIRDTLRGKRMDIFFDSSLRKYLNMLDRRSYGYIPEAAYDRRRFVAGDKKYQYYWFESKFDIQDLKKHSGPVIGLHNSWTPNWYKELSEEEVLSNNSLLSKTINYILTQ